MRTLLIFIILSISVSIYADLESLYADVVDFYSKILTFQAEINQDNYWKEIDMQKESHGMIYYNADSLYINYKEPDNQKLYILGEVIIIHELRTSQAIWMDKGDLELKPEEILKQYWIFGNAELISESGKNKIIRLISENDTIEVMLENLFIRSLEIIDEEGNSVKYTFGNECINCKLPEKIFKPQIPEHTNMIDNRNKGE